MLFDLHIFVIAFVFLVSSFIIKTQIINHLVQNEYF